MAGLRRRIAYADFCGSNGSVCSVKLRAASSDGGPQGKRFYRTHRVARCPTRLRQAERLWQPCIGGLMEHTSMRHSALSTLNLRGARA